MLGMQYIAGCCKFQIKIISMEAENTNLQLEVKQRETDVALKMEELKKIEKELDKQITNNSELLHQFLAAEDRIADGQNQVKVCAMYITLCDKDSKLYKFTLIRKIRY